jgi:hypothetical protein
MVVDVAIILGIVNVIGRFFKGGMETKQFPSPDKSDNRTSSYWTQLRPTLGYKKSNKSPILKTLTFEIGRVDRSRLEQGTRCGFT